MRTVQLAILAAAVAASTALAPPRKPSTTLQGLPPWPTTRSRSRARSPFQLPPFDRIRDADYLPAFEAGMREQLREVAAIAHNPQPPTFENTIVALERSGQLLTRVDNAFARLNACNTNPQMQKIDTEMAPKLTAQRGRDSSGSGAVGARRRAVPEARERCNLDPESLQLLTRYHTRVRARRRQALAGRAGAPAARSTTEISSLTTRFKQNVLKATAEGAVVVDDVRELDGPVERADRRGGRRRRRRADSAASG